MQVLFPLHNLYYCIIVVALRYYPNYILTIDHWKDASTVKYDTEDCKTFKIRARILKGDLKGTRRNDVRFVNSVYYGETLQRGEDKFCRRAGN